jgi:hypothetical protein
VANLLTWEHGSNTVPPWATAGLMRDRYRSDAPEIRPALGSAYAAASLLTDQGASPKRAQEGAFLDPDDPSTRRARAFVPVEGCDAAAMKQLQARRLTHAQVLVKLRACGGDLYLACRCGVLGPAMA